MDDQLLYRVEQAAPVLQMSRAAVYMRIKSGEIGSVKIGASRRIPRSELEAFVARLSAGAA